VIALRAAAATDVGRVRNVNQDGALVAAHFVVVADGMGGHRGGEIASSLALRTLEGAGSAGPFGSVDDVLRAVDAAHQTVFGSSNREPDLRGMGTTVCLLALLGSGHLVVANVGDSRAYRLSDGALAQLTVDHSLVQMLVDDGQLSAEDAERHPNRNILTRALGIEPTVQVDTWLLDPVPGQRFLVCSDGLFNEVPLEAIAEVLESEPDPARAADVLVGRANDGGGRDNITCIVADIVDDDGTLPSAAPAALLGSGPVSTGPVDVVAPASGQLLTATLPAAAAPRAVPTGDATAALPTTAPGGDGPSVGVAPAQRAPAPPAPAATKPPGRRPRLTGRLVGFVLAVAAVVAAGSVAVGWYANRTYFVGIEDEDVVVYRGRPGGLLWLDPSVAERPQPPLAAADLTELQCDRVLENQSFTDRDAALAFVDQLRSELSEAPPVSRGGAAAATPNRSACR
jgi:protein phosphatase